MTAAARPGHQQLLLDAASEFGAGESGHEPLLEVPLWRSRVNRRMPCRHLREQETEWHFEWQMGASGR